MNQPNDNDSKPASPRAATIEPASKRARLDTATSTTGPGRKQLTIKLFSKDRNFGVIECQMHTDARSVIETIRRNKKPALSHKMGAERVNKVQTHLAQAGIFESLEALSTQMEVWRSEKDSEFDANAYYDTTRALAYHEHCKAPQHRITTSALGQMKRIWMGETDPSQYALLPTPNAPRLVLDLGCGTGLGAATARSHQPGWQLIGLDSAVDMLSSDTSCLDTIQADMAQPLPFRTGVFDHSISIAALHYLFSDDANGRTSTTRLGCCLDNVARCMVEPSSSSSSSSSSQFHEAPTAVFQVFPSNPELLPSLLPIHKSGPLRSELLMDCPHHSDAHRWFYCIWKPTVAGLPSGDQIDAAVKDTHSRRFCALHNGDKEYGGIGDSWVAACPLLLYSDELKRLPSRLLLSEADSTASQSDNSVRKGKKKKKKTGPTEKLYTVEEHLEWVLNEHFRFARKLLRQNVMTSITEEEVAVLVRTSHPLPSPGVKWCVAALRKAIWGDVGNNTSLERVVPSLDEMKTVHREAVMRALHLCPQEDE